MNKKRSFAEAPWYKGWYFSNLTASRNLFLGHTSLVFLSNGSKVERKHMSKCPGKLLLNETISGKAPLRPAHVPSFSGWTGRCFHVMTTTHGDCLQGTQCQWRLNRSSEALSNQQVLYSSCKLFARPWGEVNKTTRVKNIYSEALALVGWLVHHPIDQRAMDLIPGQVTRLGWLFGPQSGHIQEAIGWCFFGIHVSPSLPLSLEPVNTSLHKG